MATVLRVKSLGEDDFSRETYKNVKNGRIYALVDGKFHSTTSEGEPESPLRGDIAVILDNQNESHTMGELLVVYLGSIPKILTVGSEDEGVALMKSAKFHGVDAIYCYRQLAVEHPTKQSQFINPSIHIVAERGIVESLVSKEGFICPTLKS